MIKWKRVKRQLRSPLVHIGLHNHTSLSLSHITAPSTSPCLNEKVCDGLSVPLLTNVGILLLVLNKYFPPDFDPELISRRKGPRNSQQVVRLMAPFSMYVFLYHTWNSHLFTLSAGGVILVANTFTKERNSMREKKLSTEKII